MYVCMYNVYLCVSTMYIYDVYIHTLPRLQEIADGNSFSVPCVNYLAGWEGNAGGLRDTHHCGRGGPAKQLGFKPLQL